jgi:hypothetical protein
MNNPQNPEILAFALLPSPGERRRRELMLVRLMLVATDLVVSGEGIGLQSARDLVHPAHVKKALAMALLSGEFCVCHGHEKPA